MTGGITWPARYIDPQTGASHDWDDQVPPDLEDEGYDDGTSPYTYRDLMYDQAAARGMEVDEYLEHLTLRRGEGLDEKWSPDYIDDGDGYGL